MSIDLLEEAVKVKSNIAIAVLAALASLPALAGTWTKEPRTVLGFELGSEVTNAQLCDSPERTPDRACIDAWSTSADKFYSLQSVPNLGFTVTGAAVSTLNGRLRTVALTSPQSEWHSVKLVLIERYGSPTQKQVSGVTNLAGAVLSSETLRWLGNEVSIVATERSGRVDTSTAMFFSNKLNEEAAENERKASKQGAGKL